MTSFRIKKIKNAIIYFVTAILLRIIKLSTAHKKEKTLLLIRLDAIGDYILFRNFIEIIRHSEIYHDYKITLCGNIVWQSLAETFDKIFVDDFIWVDRKKLYTNYFYKYQFLKKIYNCGFEIVFETTHSREILFGDTIVNAANARHSVGSIGSGEEFTTWKRKMLTNKLYSRLIEISNNNLFEFNINKELFGKFLNQNLSINKPYLDTSAVQKSSVIKNKYILLFPGSTDPLRMWSSHNFKTVADFLMNNYKYDIVLTGSKQESYLFNEITGNNSSTRFINLFGNFLHELAGLVSDAELLISNDTSAVHFAAASDTPFVCVSNGSYFGRFNPYPFGTVINSIHIYPPVFMEKMNDQEHLLMNYRYNTDIDINEIKPQVVIEEIKKLLK